MGEIRREYAMLFNGISATIQQLELTVARLKDLQVRAEAEYMERGGDDESHSEEPPATTRQGPGPADEEEK